MRNSHGDCITMKKGGCVRVCANPSEKGNTWELPASDSEKGLTHVEPLCGRIHTMELHANPHDTGLHGVFAQNLLKRGLHAKPSKWDTCVNPCGGGLVHGLYTSSFEMELAQELCETICGMGLAWVACKPMCKELAWGLHANPSK